MSELPAVQNRDFAWRGKIAGRTAALLVLVAFIATLALLQMHVFHFQRQFFTSDDAVVNTLASSMWEQRRLYPRNWINNNGDLMIPSGALIVASLLAWLPNGFIAHSVAGAFATAFILASFLGLMRALGISLTVSLATAIVLMAGFSYSCEALVFAQTTYVWWPAGFFLGAALILVYRIPPPGAPRFPARLLPLALGVLVFTISIANPDRIFPMMFLPLLVFDRVVAHGLEKDRGARATSVWLRRVGFGDPLTQFGLVGAFVLAVVVYWLLARYGFTQGASAASTLRWTGWSGIPRHAEMFGHWFEFFGPTKAALFSGDAVPGSLLVFRWIVALFVTATALWESIRLVSQPDVMRRAFAAAMLSAFLPICMMYLMFDPLASHPSTLRYFIVPVLLALPLCALSLQRWQASQPRITTVCLPASGLALMVIAAYLYVPVASIGRPGFWTVRESQSMQLAQLLEREGLRWGYATWWNAGATTVHADSQIRVLPVVFLPEGIERFPSMVSKDWYREQAWRGPTFLALAREEASPANLAMVHRTLGEPVRRVEGFGYEILVYDSNFSSRFENPAGSQ